MWASAEHRTDRQGTQVAGQGGGALGLRTACTASSPKSSLAPRPVQLTTRS